MLSDNDIDRITQDTIELKEYKERNEELKEVLSNMNMVVNGARQTQSKSLLELSSLCEQLAEVEDRRDQIVNNLKSLKTQLLLTSQKSQQIQQIFNKEKELLSPVQKESKQFTATNETCLKAVNYLNSEIAKIISTCLHSGDMTVSTKELNTLTNNFHRIIATYDQTGLIKLSDEDKIQQNKLMLKKLK